MLAPHIHTHAHISHNYVPELKPFTCQGAISGLSMADEQILISVSGLCDYIIIFHVANKSRVNPHKVIIMKPKACLWFVNIAFLFSPSK